MQAYLVPCWWVSWWLWRAGCISQDTYLLYQIENEDNDDDGHPQQQHQDPPHRVLDKYR